MSKALLMRLAAILLIPVIVAGTGNSAFAAKDSDSDVSIMGNTWVEHLGGDSSVDASMGHIDDGDYFQVWDDNRDGHGVRGYLYVYTSPTDTSLITSKYNGNGVGTYVSFGYDVLSAFTYRMKVCTVDGSSDYPDPSDCTWRNFTE